MIITHNISYNLNDLVGDHYICLRTFPATRLRQNIAAVLTCRLRRRGNRAVGYEPIEVISNSVHGPADRLRDFASAQRSFLLKQLDNRLAGFERGVSFGPISSIPGGVPEPTELVTFIANVYEPPSS